MKQTTILKEPELIYFERAQSSGAYYLAALALFSGIALTVISWLRVCSQSCADSHSYRLFGFTFEDVGMIFFPLLAITHLLSGRIQILSLFTGWMLCTALGAEAMFLYIQKYVIKAWCPICLSIASVLAIAGLVYLCGYFSTFKLLLERKNRGLIMNNIFKGFAGVIAFVVGFILAFSGISKHNELNAEEDIVKQQVAFGNLNSPIEVYVFTDWECPACRSLEPVFEKVATAVMPKAKLTFVDDPVHSATLNFTPYHLSFMINNKPNYLTLRSGLTNLSETTKEPSQQQITALAASKGVNFTPLNYETIAMGSRYFEHLIRHFNVEGTPTVVVVNKNNKKSKKLEGSTDINEENILKAVDVLSAGS